MHLGFLMLGMPFCANGARLHIMMAFMKQGKAEELGLLVSTTYLCDSVSFKLRFGRRYDKNI